MGTVVFKCDLVNIGHNWLGSEPASFTVYKASGAFPASAAAYDITSATFAINNASSVVRQSGTGTKLQIVDGAILLNDGAWLGAGTGALSFALSPIAQLATLTACTLKLSGGWQLTSGSTCVITVNYLEKVSQISSISKPSMDAGQAQTVTIAANSAAFTHKLIYSLGSQSVTRDMAAGATSDSWTVPLAWLDQMRNTASATVSLALQTYYGGVLTGTTYSTFTLTCPASIVPTIGSTAAVPNGTTTIGTSLFVKGKTGVTASMSGVAVSYATLVSTGISVGGYGAGFSGSGTSLATGALPQSGTVRITYWATDSRGRTGYAYRDITVKDYALPSLSRAVAYRVATDGTPSPVGTQGMFAFDLTRSAPGGSYATKVEILRSGAVLASFTGVSGSGKIVTGAGSTTPLTVAPETEYELVFRVSDSYNASGMTVTVVLPSAMAALSFNGAFDGVGFGMIAQRSKALELAKDWDLIAYGDSLGRALTPHNFLDNSNFERPVNQRGISPTTVIGYCWDRWKFWFDATAGYASTNDGYAVVAGGGQIFQNLDAKALVPNRDYTLVRTDANGNIAAFSGKLSTTWAGGGFGYFCLGSDGIPVICLYGDGRTYRNIALYEGVYTDATAPRYQPKDYATELAACRRYYYRQYVGNWACGHVLNGWGFYVPVMSEAMRVNPTVTGAVSYFGDDGAWHDGYNLTAGSNEQGIYLMMNADYVTSGKSYLCIINVALSADY